MDEWLGGIKYAIYVFIVIVVDLEISLGIKGYDFYNSSKEQKAAEENWKIAKSYPMIATFM